MRSGSVAQVAGSGIEFYFDHVVGPLLPSLVETDPAPLLDEDIASIMERSDSARIELRRRSGPKTKHDSPPLNMHAKSKKTLLLYIEKSSGAR